MGLLGEEPSIEAIFAAKVHLEYYGGAINNIIMESGGPLTKGYVIQNERIQPVHDFMADEGWEFAGSGYFSAVYVKGGLAIKVGMKREDSGAVYAAWCRANRGKPGVPTIHAVDKFKGCYVVLMDRCYPTHNLTATGSGSPTLRSEIRVIRDLINNGRCSMDNGYFDTAGTAKEIHEFFSGIACFDPNSGNLMLDRDGQLIITDPVSFDDGHSNDRDSGSYYSYYTATA